MATIHTSDLEDNIALFIKERLPKAAIGVVFDVGANIGWVTLQFANAFPEARIYSFEPVPSIIQQMKDNLARFSLTSNINYMQCALGNASGEAMMTIQPDVTVNQIVTSSDLPTAKVEIMRGDDFCRREGVVRIDFVKVDAEGHDLQVLEGFSDMFAREAINFVQVEAGMSDDNVLHVPLKRYSDFLEPLGFKMLTIRNQASNQVPILMWADVVFIRAKYALECV